MSLIAGLKNSIKLQKLRADDEEKDAPKQDDNKGGVIGGIKNTIASFKSKPAAAPTTATPTTGADSPASGADTIMGGDTAISTSSMKGSALANDPSSNLARKSEYRNVFHKRGAEGKHNWGGK